MCESCLEQNASLLEQSASLQSKLGDSRNSPFDDGGSRGETQNKRFQVAIKCVIEDCIVKDKRFNRWGPRRHGKQLANVSFSILGGVAEHAMLKKSKKILRVSLPRKLSCNRWMNMVAPFCMKTQRFFGKPNR